ncbi:23S rRNA (pseudouridine(1915)-N(3))-methyltransferase RlmH [Endozoicomonas gorgoniicola]|uniref:Ribosomal RNA large subunit methyltransferase H n=1 Tax=Endozoicomonas gorgoniicola TaxID=1234144 RepID=A0ABT3MYG6_9GAMM|nr:23S rRNA (pseudouridine(1915)-N(3))-methyltransferase RlmH [Endozoicomonas gorgoniicola]MCW7554421.1 23S rRNA (pseudouridine(1915)-N(3))-methyltransferase RlmH [Endozoicomonas gorgoniicola]
MRIRLITVGSKMPGWVEEGYTEYSRRLGADLKLELVEIPLNRRSKGADVNRLQEKEANQILAAVGRGDLVVTMEINGKAWSTEQLADKMGDWMHSGRNVSLLVGGPEGLHPSCMAQADLRWSLSPLTLPHPLVRVVVAEQVYRAWSILKNHPYHK